MPGAPVFYYDVGSPFAYLSGERIDGVLGADVRWQPVLLGGIFKATGRSSWARTDARAVGMREVELRAARQGLPPLAWPDPWPNDGLFAMRMTMHAELEGKGREFALAVMRAAFVDGRPQSDSETVLAVAAEVGLDPEGATAQATKDALRAATDAAVERGVFGVPTFAVGDELFWGDDRLEEAAACLPPTR